MGRGPDMLTSTLERMEETTKQVFEPKLAALNLTVRQIEHQDLRQLQTSLERVNDAIQHAESFGTIKLRMDVERGPILVQRSDEGHFEVGILPLLLERKALILERMNALRPQEQIRDFRQEVIDSVEDAQVREQLLKVLDEHEATQQELSSRIQQETAKVTSALAAETSELAQAASIARLETRVDGLDKSVGKLEDKSVTRFDVVTIVFAILAALGGLTAAILGIVKWAAA